MPYWIFTEDMDGKLGCLGYKNSEVMARSVADDYTGITHVKFYETYNRVEAKRFFKGERVKEHPEEGHKNIHNLGSEHAS